MSAPTITDTDQQVDDGPEVAPAGQYPDGTQWAGPLCELDKPVPGQFGQRVLPADGAVIRPLPLPLSFQFESSHGGQEPGTTVIVGRILGAQVEDNMLVAYGDFLDPGDNFQSADAIQSAAQRVVSGLGLVSVDTAPTVVEFAIPGSDGTLTLVDPMLYDGDGDDIVQVFAQWELMGVTMLADPAFGTARIAPVEGALMPGDQDGAGMAPPMIDGDPGSFTAAAEDTAAPTLTVDAVTFADGTVVHIGDEIGMTGDGPSSGLLESIDPGAATVTVAVEDETADGGTSTITVDAADLQPADSTDSDAEPDSDEGGMQAAGAPHQYPADWFEPVALDGPTGITVSDDGRVYGHLATFGVCHTGYSECVTAPSSSSGYSYFHLGEVDTTAGPLAVGKLTVGGGHADPKFGWRGTVEHYDNAGAAVAVVRAHEDDHGIQVTGGILPTATPEQVAALRRSPLSGDWRRIGGNLELVAALGVSVPGFPVPRAALAASGQQLSLVAAGVVRAEAGDGEPETTGAVTLPSGTQLTAVDVAVLASAFDKAAAQRAERLAAGGALREQLRADRAARLRARVQG